MEFDYLKIVSLSTSLAFIGAVVLYSAKTAANYRIVTLPVVFITLSMSFYIPGLIAGALNQLTGWFVYLYTIVISMLGLIIFSKLPKQAEISPNHEASPPISSENYLVLGIGIILLSPLLSLLYALPKALLDREIWLPWDSVSYHLPALVEYLHAKSLWSSEGPYQSYSFAYELVANFGIYWFPSHVGFIFGNAFSAVFLGGSIYYLTSIISGQTSFLKKILPISVFCLAFGLWLLVFKNKLISIGKNDIFQCACLLSSLGFMLDLFMAKEETNYKKTFLIVLGFCGLGLAIGTKPTALAYIPFFIVILVLSALNSNSSQKGKIRILKLSKVIFLFLSGIYLIGGFFLTRNVILYGTINPLPGAWNLSLVANLSNSALYEFKLGGLVFVVGAVSIFLWIVPLVVCKDKRSKQIFVILALFHMTAMMAFVITPHAIFHNTTAWTTWKLRLGLPFFTCMVLIISMVFCYLCEKLGRNKFFYSVTLITFTSIGFLFFIVRGTLYPMKGLPHYEQIKNHSATSVYEWVQEKGVPLRIYSAGLRPYGLYGKQWKNKVFYDLHTNTLIPVEKGKKRILSVLHQFQPDLIIVSVDPHPYSPGNDKPEITLWLTQREDCFSLKYIDNSVSVFGVKKTAISILDKEIMGKVKKIKRQG